MLPHLDRKALVEIFSFSSILNTHLLSTYAPCIFDRDALVFVSRSRAGLELRRQVIPCAMTPRELLTLTSASRKDAPGCGQSAQGAVNSGDARVDASRAPFRSVRAYYIRTGAGYPVVLLRNSLSTSSRR